METKAEQVFMAMDPREFAKKITEERQAELKRWMEQRTRIEFNGSFFRLRKKSCGLWWTVQQSDKIVDMHDTQYRLAIYGLRSRWVKFPNSI